MIERSNPNLTAGIKSVWRQCFTNEDERYTEFFFRLIYKPEYGYAVTDRGRVVSTLCRPAESGIRRRYVRLPP